MTLWIGLLDLVLLVHEIKYCLFTELKDVCLFITLSLRR